MKKLNVETALNNTTYISTAPYADHIKQLSFMGHAGCYKLVHNLSQYLQLVLYYN